MVPDVSGIDKVFDYLVPESLSSRIWIGARVRINLNNRRVGGWVVDLSHDQDAEKHSFHNRLLPVVSVSGHGVEPELVPLTQWMAEYFFGSWRSTLSSASAPHVRAQPAHRRSGHLADSDDDELSRHVRDLASRGGGLLVVPPLESALRVVTELVRTGPVLVVCPTQKMAALGGAYLRRRGLVTAMIPEQWDHGRAGVDVVIGARSAVLAPCAELSAIVVIDEHDELLQEERSPTWHAREVAWERAKRAGIPCIVTSPVPSAASSFRCRNDTVVAQSSRQWPTIEIVNLDDVPVAGSLLSSELLAEAHDEGKSIACLLNTKGKARLVLCRTCRAVQICSVCSSLLAYNDDVLMCLRCNTEHGSVCVSCGRTSFLFPRGGTGQLASQLRTSVHRDVVEVHADSDDTWTQGSLFVGTEALLHRLSRVDVVVFADIDRDLSAPRMTATREVLALIARASRLVGETGKIIIQTRKPDHRVLRAVADNQPVDALHEWGALDLSQREVFDLPPYSRLAEVSVRAPHRNEEIPSLDSVQLARHNDFVLVKARDDDSLRQAVATLRELFGVSLRIHVDPARY